MNTSTAGEARPQPANEDAAHEPFRPSNSDHGFWFESQWCDKCQRERSYRESNGERGGCRILNLTNAFNIEDPQYPKEWRQDGPEGPRCTAFEPERERAPRGLPRRDDRAAVGDLFA